MIKVVKNFVGPLADDRDIEKSQEDGSNYITGFKESNVILPEDVLAKFFKLAFQEEKVEINIGYPRKELSHPSIYISAPVTQLQKFLGNNLGSSITPQNKLEFTKEYDHDGNVVSVKSNIATREAPSKMKGHLATSQVRVTIYSDNYNIARRLSEAVYSNIMYNFGLYLADVAGYDDSIKESFDPKFASVDPAGIYVNYHDELAGAKYLWSISIGLDVKYITRVEELYTFLTEICVTENVKAPITEELIETNTYRVP